jgi:hypothetical protein
MSRTDTLILALRTYLDCIDEDLQKTGLHHDMRVMLVRQRADAVHALEDLRRMGYTLQSHSLGRVFA